MVKRSGWRKLALAFNVSFECRCSIHYKQCSDADCAVISPGVDCVGFAFRSEELERDDNGMVRYARFVQRAIMPDGRFSDGWGACDHREKRFAKPNHDVRQQCLGMATIGVPLLRNLAHSHAAEFRKSCLNVFSLRNGIVWSAGAGNS